MKIITLLNAAKVFEQFAQMKVLPKLAYKIMKFCKHISIEEEFYNTKRIEIIKEYAEKDDNGNPIISEDGMVNIIKGKRDEFGVAIQELNDIEVDVPNIRFTLSELEGLELSVADMYALDAFIDE